MKLPKKQQKELDALIQKAVHGYQIPIMELSQVSAAGQKAYLAGEDVDKAVKDFMHHKNYKKSAYFIEKVSALENKLALDFVEDEKKHDAILDDLALSARAGVIHKVKEIIKHEAQKIAHDHGVKIQTQIRTHSNGVQTIELALESFVGMMLQNDKMRIGSLKQSSEHLKSEIGKFESLMSKYSDLGASDSEPRSYFHKLMDDAVDGKPFPSVQWKSWQLYNDQEGAEKAANHLTSEAKKLFEVIQKAPYKDVIEVAKYHGFGSRRASSVLKFFSGPGHGWLEVPEKVYKDSGIAASHYSYYSKNKKMVYLEEDSDAPKFEKAMKDQGKHFHVETKNIEDESFIRNLSRMPGY